jgi:hypothetical protein
MVVEIRLGAEGFVAVGAAMNGGLGVDRPDVFLQLVGEPELCRTLSTGFAEGGDGLRQTGSNWFRLPFASYRGVTIFEVNGKILDIPESTVAHGAGEDLGGRLGLLKHSGPTSFPELEFYLLSN